MSPILVRPVREQLEHDRVIRLLQAKYKRKFDVAINPGHDRTAPVGPVAAPWYPDLVLHTGKKLAGVVEVETVESLNHLEAMSQWVAFSKLRVAFHLYVPASGVDSARRLSAEAKVNPAELWAYQAFGEQIRFTLVARGPQPAGARGGARRTATAAAARGGRAARAASATTRRTASASSSRSKPRAGAAAKTAKKKAAPARRAAKSSKTSAGGTKRAGSLRAQKRK